MTSKLDKETIKAIQKRCLYKPSLVWDLLTDDEKEEAFRLAERYKHFLDQAKTEREAVAFLREQALKKGFQPVDITSDIAPSTGRYFKTFRGKVIGLAVTGNLPVSEGFHLVASHIDSPRLDLKQNPLYEELDLALLKTHYYGGIRKYQWLARPLALHGKVITGNGNELNIVIGEADHDPVFTISDLLPHLAGKIQGNKKISEAFEGEKLNLLCGSIPIAPGETKERFKLMVLHYLYETYGMTEEDFISAEFEAVPAGKARDIGFDRSLIGAYGHDDRICAFTSFEALLSVSDNQHTAIAFFYDKEEIGSEGNTGAQSCFMKEFISDLLIRTGRESDEKTLRKALINARALSADVNAAMDPDYQEVHEKRNAARLGYGICLTKFTGAGGKKGANDANAEYVGTLRNLFNDKGVVWQTGELGKVDEGGGGTVAKFLASYGMDVIDCGPAVLSMHSPFEVASKGDLFETVKAYAAFYHLKLTSKR
jgi:aspartyl aminopeptidase